MWPHILLDLTFSVIDLGLVQIICAGFLRTGTTTLTLALERLGFGPCYHMRTVQAEPWRAEDWIAAADEPAAADWERILSGFESTVGDPGALFWRHLIDAFPDAKVILSVRDPQQWYESASRTIFPALEGPPLPLRLLTWRRPSREDRLLDRLQRLTWELDFGNDFADRDRAVEVFTRRIADVRAHVPADRLLVYDVREGWEPLCAFLGVPVPDEPMPRENDRAAFQARQRSALMRVVGDRARKAAAIGVGAALTAWVVRRLRSAS
ncbi:sulfotransferase family protein [Thermomonospora cellulosilytica]|nr:sulfotransferase family protein [Thermomonospora cellulosilytica]